MINISNLPPFKKMCVTIGNLPSSFMESMTYYEALCWLYNWLDKTVIPAINTEGEAITELQNAFTTLKNYVDNYFNNLDVQEEINNKLDDMAEAGTLQEIITAYLQVNGLLAYNTVADMKLAENLVDGSFARTLGYYNINDEGGATYKIRNITNEDVVDEMTIIALADENLVAELIVDEAYVNVRKFGIRETETGNISTKIGTIITYLNNKNLIPYIPLLNIDTTLTIPMSARIKIDKINYTGNTYAVALSQGIYGNIEIENIYSLTGAGIHINPEGTYSGNGYYRFNRIAVNGNSIYFDNDSTIVNSTFEGIQLYSREDDALVIKPLTDSVLGQCTIKFNNIYAVDHTGIVIDTTYGSLTNLDFGYTSVEGSTDGILLNLVNYTEGMKGYFRVNEVGSHQDNSYILKIKGEAQDVRNQIDFTFDSYRYDKIDLSELTMNTYASRGTPNILIQGKCFNGVGESLGYSGRIMNNRLCMDYINASNPYNLTADIDLNYETSNSTPRISSNFTTSGLANNITVTLPKSLKPGVISSINNTTGNSVTIKPYGNPNSSGLTLSTSGLFTTVIDGNGKLQIIQL